MGTKPAMRPVALRLNMLLKSSLFRISQMGASPFLFSHPGLERMLTYIHTFFLLLFIPFFSHFFNPFHFTSHLSPASRFAPLFAHPHFHPTSHTHPTHPHARTPTPPGIPDSLFSPSLPLLSVIHTPDSIPRPSPSWITSHHLIVHSRHGSASCIIFIFNFLLS